MTGREAGVEVGMGERIRGTGEALRERLPRNRLLTEDDMVAMIMLFRAGE